MPKDVLRVHGRSNLHTNLDEARSVELEVQSQTISAGHGINVIHVRMITTPRPVNLNDLYEMDIAIELERAKAATEWVSQFSDPDWLPEGTHQLTVIPSSDKMTFVKPDAYVKRGKIYDKTPVTLLLEAYPADDEFCLGIRMSASNSSENGQWFVSAKLNRLQSQVFYYMLRINYEEIRHHKKFWEEWKKNRSSKT
jgi:hypothetical protein